MFVLFLCLCWFGVCAVFICDVFICDVFICDVFICDDWGLLLGEAILLLLCSCFPQLVSLPGTEPFNPSGNFSKCVFSSEPSFLFQRVSFLF